MSERPEIQEDGYPTDEWLAKAYPGTTGQFATTLRRYTWWSSRPSAFARAMMSRDEFVAKWPHEDPAASGFAAD